jgi:hypothetical protein
VVRADAFAFDHSATVVFDPDTTSVEDLTNALKKGGYKVKSFQFLD